MSDPPTPSSKGAFATLLDPGGGRAGQGPALGALSSGHAAGSARTVRDVAIARSGDKGNRATLSVIARDPADFGRLEAALTVERVHALYAGIVRGEVRRWLLPQLGAVHFVLDDALAGGVTRSLALDAHGKTLSSAVLGLPLEDAG